MQRFLDSSEFIDWQQPQVLARAQLLAADSGAPADTARNCFEWVRDHIRHSADHRLNPVTCKASEALQHKTGYCYAKSHLLAALLRANGIPAALCYQRLSIDDTGAPFCLHGLNAVYLQSGWYRIDARGNKPGVDARFTPPIEQLAFSLNFPEEADLPELYAEPLPQVIDVLQNSHSYLEVQQNLPDIDLGHTA